MAGTTATSQPLPKKANFMNAAPKTKQNIGDVLAQHLELLYRIARRLTGNDPDAEDLVSQTIILAFNNWDKNDGCYPKSWLITILRNEFYQTVRKRNRRSESSLDNVAEPTQDNFWQAIDRQLEVEKILEAVDSIADEYREVITLCDIEEFNYEEAAQILAIPIGTVKSRLFRARKLVRSKLTAYTAN